MKLTPNTAHYIIIAILLVGALTLRGLGIDSLMEWIIIAIAAGHLGLDQARPRR